MGPGPQSVSAPGQPPVVLPPVVEVEPPVVLVAPTLVPALVPVLPVELVVLLADAAELVVPTLDVPPDDERPEEVPADVADAVPDEDADGAVVVPKVVAEVVPLEGPVVVPRLAVDELDVPAVAGPLVVPVAAFVAPVVAPVPIAVADVPAAEAEALTVVLSLPEPVGDAQTLVEGSQTR